jgi:TonB family protein
MSTAATWFLYCTAIGGLLGLAALSGEEAARSAGRPGRLVWFAAMLASVTIPGVAYFGPEAWASPAVFTEGPIVLAPIIVTPVTEGGWSIERLIVKLWIAMSVGLGSYLLWSFTRLRRARQSWRRERLEGIDVWLTRDVGPAVFGLAEASILMPAWALDLDERLRRLMLLHEEEHARAGDPQLVLAALIVLVAMPWNATLWWQMRRLRMAVEVDCDARVLRREPDRRRYGTLLLEVGRRRGGSSLVVAFAEPRAFLETRIRRIAARSSRRLRRAAPLAIIALVLFAAAFTARDPAAASQGMPAAEARAFDRVDPTAGVASPTELPAVPEFGRSTVEPELTNTAQIAQALAQLYPPLLSEAGIGGTTEFWFHIDETGAVRRTTLYRSSGHAVLDEAAQQVAALMRFSPARDGDQRVPVWRAIPVTFRPQPRPSVAESPNARPLAIEPETEPERLPMAAAAADAAAGTATTPIHEPIDVPGPTMPAPPRIDFSRIVPRLDPPRTRAAPLEDGPRFTPYTQKPELANAADVARALQRNYPPLLRDSGVGGTTLVWFLIDERGAVQRKDIHRTSGHAALDEAALSVADRMRFRPAENRGEKVAVWVQIPITFSSR